MIKQDLPLGPFLVAGARITKPHVEVGWHDEGEEGDGGCPNKVKNATKVWDCRRDEQQDDNAHASEQATFPVEV